MVQETYRPRFNKEEIELLIHILEKRVPYFADSHKETVRSKIFNRLKKQIIKDQVIL